MLSQKLLRSTFGRLVGFSLLGSSLFSKLTAEPTITNSVAYRTPRLGDRLLSYILARWVAYKLDLPFAYQTFPDSKHVLHPLYPNLNKRKNLPIANSLEEIDLKTNQIYAIMQKYHEPTWEIIEEVSSFDTLLEDEAFLETIRKEIWCSGRIQPDYPPKDKLSIAIHYRSGKGWDPAKRFEKWPHKFIPLSFYIEELHQLTKIYSDQQLHITLFTDDPNPEEIRKIFTQNYPAITIHLPKSHKRGFAHIEDFFAMTKYDILIRSRSNFAQVAQLLGKHKLVIYPKRVSFRDGGVIVDEVGKLEKKYL